MIKILIGGSPCTYWSIAQSKGRETTAEGIGWELFKNYLIAKEKFQPDFFLYENNKSAAQAIKDQIKRELDVNDGSFFGHGPGRYIEINSALVSAQNRQRFYVHNFGDVPQPEDRGIILQDILESGMNWNEKSYALTTRYAGATIKDTLTRKRHTMTTERIEGQPIAIYEKACTLRASGGTKQGQSNLIRHIETNGQFGYMGVPVRIGTIESDVEKKDNDSQQYRVYSPEGKSVTLCGNGGGLGAKTGLYAVQITMRNRREADGKLYRRFETHGGGKANALTTVQTDSMVGIRSEIQEANYEVIDGANIYITNNAIRQGDKRGSKQGKYVYLPCARKTNTISAGQAHNEKVIIPATEGQWRNIYTVRDGLIEIKGVKYPIRLPDGQYIIRKPTPIECERLQTLPDGYTRAVSDSQRYKGLGNGWTAEVIIHLLSYALKDVPRNEKIVVLSMYDGIGTGRYCLDKMGFTNVEYHAYEIDKFAIQIALSNYSDIIEHGDAFAVREEGWQLESGFGGKAVAAI